MTLEHYLKNYTYSFKDKPFNEVDNLVFSTLAYLNYSKILDKGKISLTKLADVYLTMCPRLPKNSPFAYKDAFKMIKLVKDNPRYSDVLVYNYTYDTSDEYQFGALTYEFLNNLYIAFEGTDDLISGWEEDFRMAYTFPVEAHKKAIKYLSRYFLTNKNIYVGGHSKGGNLALVASMYTNIFVKSRIVKIYSNDGPGLRSEEFKTFKYRHARKKLVRFIPQNSVIGLLFNHEGDIVIKSKSPILFSHAPLSWKIDVDTFERCELSKASMIFDDGVSNLLKNYSNLEKEKCVVEVFDILREHDIKTLSQIKGDLSNVFKIIKSSKKVSKETKKLFSDISDIINKMIKQD